jgi:bifunctional DNA-binding transcriptional regulator/antitoxin component of YhaV-PrlF toxin-antitoxin module
MKLGIAKTDDETVIVLPAKLASRLGWKPGDICEARVDGDHLSIIRTETKHERAMRIARQGMKRYRHTLAKLAKS